MAQARPVYPGTIYLITRRTVQRQFLIKPSRQVNGILLYCLAYAAALHGIKVHCFCFLSNHYHLVLTDPDAQLPKFMASLNKYTSKCLNTLYGREGALWEPGSYSRVELGDAETVVQKVIYTLLNPVEAGLVRKGEDWPGLRTRAGEVGTGEYTAQRPIVFFREDGEVPEAVTLKLSPPPGVTGKGIYELQRQLCAEITAREAEIQSRLETQGKTFLGPRRVLAQSILSFATTRERWRTLNPLVACRNRLKRIRILVKLKKFMLEYREALQRYVDGEHNVVFPCGTYLMRVRFGVQCAPT